MRGGRGGGETSTWKLPSAVPGMGDETASSPSTPNPAPIFHPFYSSKASTPALPLPFGPHPPPCPIALLRRFTRSRRSSSTPSPGSRLGCFLSYNKSSHPFKLQSSIPNRYCGSPGPRVLPSIPMTDFQVTWVTGCRQTIWRCAVLAIATSHRHPSFEFVGALVPS